MTEITIYKTNVSDGGVSYDLQVTNLPSKFLGLATDIVFSGDLQRADYQGMELGRVFDGLSSTQMPIKMVKALPDQGRLVMGITLKSNDLPTLEDGVLVSFHFKNDVLAVTGFEHSVLSSFSGVRNDISDVQWTVSEAAKQIGTDVSNIAVQEKANGSKDDNPLSVLLGQNLASDGNFESNIYAEEMMEILNAPLSAEEASLISWWWGVIFVTLFLMIGAVLYLKRRFIIKKFARYFATGRGRPASEIDTGVAGADLA